MIGLNFGDGIFFEPEFASDRLILRAVDELQRIRFISSVVLSETSILYRLDRTSGRSFIVQATQEIPSNNWVPVWTNRNSGGFVDFITTDTDQFTKRFFRVLELFGE